MSGVIGNYFGDIEDGGRTSDDCAELIDAG
jgi:hypothetical protein